eukprot:5225651-Prymnesium_polylepis.1
MLWYSSVSLFSSASVTPCILELIETMNTCTFSRWNHALQTPPMTWLEPSGASAGDLTCDGGQ